MDALHDDAQLVGRFVPGAGLEAAVGVDVEALGRQHFQAALDLGDDVIDGLDDVAVDIDDAPGDLLVFGEALGLQQLDEFLAAVDHLQIELLDWQIEKARVGGDEVAVADVGAGLGVHALRGDRHRFDRQLDILEPRRERGLVDLDERGAGAVEFQRFVVNRFRHFEHSLPERVVAFEERPLDHGVGAGEHALDGLLGEALGVAPEVDRDRLRPAHGVLDDGLVIVAIAVGAHETADLHTLEMLGEVDDHVAAGHLTIDEDIEADLLLQGDHLARRLFLELVQLLPREFAGGELIARLLKIGRLGEAADRGGQ